MAFEYTRDNINEYVKDKTWYWYLPLWIFGTYLFIQILGFSFDKQLAFAVMVPNALNFALHEFAHIFTAFFPALFSAFAGSLSELLLGLILIVVAFKTRGYFASMFCFLWFMLSCMSVGSYMSDARSQDMELVSLGGALSGSDEVIHDWNFIFGELGWLSADTFIGGMVKGIGILAGLFGVLFAAWLLYKMAAAHEKQPMSETEKELLRKSITSTSFDMKTPGPAKQTKQGVYPAATKGALADVQQPQEEPPSKPQP